MDMLNRNLTRIAESAVEPRKETEKLRKMNGLIVKCRNMKSVKHRGPKRVGGVNKINTSKISDIRAYNIVNT